MVFKLLSKTIWTILIKLSSLISTIKGNNVSFYASFITNFTLLDAKSELFSLGVSDFSYILPELFLVTMVLFLFTYGIFMEKPKYNYQIPQEFLFFSLLILFFTFILTLNVLHYENRILFEGLIVVDKATTLIKLFCIGISATCLIISSDYLQRSRLGCFEFFILFLICVWAVMFFISSLDLFTLFLSLEVQGICFYALVAMNRNSGYCAEAGIKYFILGAFSSGILIFGISMIYGATGTTNMLSLFHILRNTEITNFFLSNSVLTHLDLSLVAPNSKLLLGFLFLFVGLLFKVTAVPFHMWAPDIYEGAPFATVVFISTVPKVAVFFIFSKFTGFYFADLESLWTYLFVSCGALSIIVGTFFAIRQYKTKRFLAYSSITHMGYILLGLSTGTFEGVKFSMVYVIIYVIALLNMWSLISIMENNYGQKIDSILDFGGIFYKNKTIGWNLIFTLFSLSGLPPFVGFFAKYFLLYSLVHSSMYVITSLVIVASLFSIYYYAKIIKIVLYDSKVKLLIIKQSVSVPLALISSISLCLMFIFYHIPLLHTFSELFIQSFFI